MPVTRVDSLFATIEQTLGKPLSETSYGEIYQHLGLPVEEIPLVLKRAASILYAAMVTALGVTEEDTTALVTVTKEDVMGALGLLLLEGALLGRAQAA